MVTALAYSWLKASVERAIVRLAARMSSMKSFALDSHPVTGEAPEVQRRKKKYIIID